MNEKRSYTPSEIDQRIPQLEKIFDHIQTCKSRAETLASHALRASLSHEAARIAENQLFRSQIEFLMSAVQEDIHQILALGGVVKDIEEALVDFLGEVEGQEVWLCWKKGEPNVRYWHALEAGFAQRQPLLRRDINTTLH